MKTYESFWFEYYGSGRIGDKHKPVRKFKWRNLWIVGILAWCVIITLWLIFK
jgi:hypothetical protein